MSCQGGPVHNGLKRSTDLLNLRQPIFPEPYQPQGPLPVRFRAVQRRPDEEARGGLRKRSRELLRELDRVVPQAHEHRGQGRRRGRGQAVLLGR